MSDGKVNKSAMQKVLLGIRIFLLAVLGVITIFALILIIQSFLPADKMPGLFRPSIATEETMAPEINRGDFLLLKNGGEINAGDVVSYKTDKGFVLARVISAENGTLTVKGDAEHEAFAAVISVADVRGVWGGFKIPYLGYLLSWMQTPAGCVSVVAAIILIDLAVSFGMRKAAEKRGAKEREIGAGIFGTLLLDGLELSADAVKNGKKQENGKKQKNRAPESDDGGKQK